MLRVRRGSSRPRDRWSGLHRPCMEPFRPQQGECYPPGTSRRGGEAGIAEWRTNRVLAVPR